MRNPLNQGQDVQLEEGDTGHVDHPEVRRHVAEVDGLRGGPEEDAEDDGGDELGLDLGPGVLQAAALQHVEDSVEGGVEWHVHDHDVHGDLLHDDLGRGAGQDPVQPAVPVGEYGREDGGPQHHVSADRGPVQGAPVALGREDLVQQHLGVRSQAFL